MISIKSLESLLAVYRLGSFVAAAKELGVSQPAISMQIKSLEDELGTPLFDRSVRPPVLTARGKLMIEPMTRVIDLMGLIAGIASSKCDDRVGSLRVGAVHTALLSLVPEALDVMRRRHSDLDVTVQSGQAEDLIDKVQTGQLDMVLTPVRAGSGFRLRSQELFRDDLVLVGPSLCQSTAARLPALKLDREDELSSLVDRLARIHRPDGGAVFTLDSVESILAMVGKGLGVAILPRIALMALNSFRLSFQPLDDPLASRSLYLLHRSDGEFDKIADDFSASLREVERLKYSNGRLKMAAG